MEKFWSLYVHIVSKELTGLSHDKYYVGITGREPEKRWMVNGHGYQGKSHDVFWNDIKKYGWDNIKHKVILTNLTEEHALEVERLYIQIFRSNNPEYGYNQNDGGFGGNVKPLVPVVQYDSDGNYIKTWDSGAEAARAMGVSRGVISHAVKSHYTVKGYQWEYVNAPNPGPFVKRTGKTPNNRGPRPNKQGANAYQARKVVLLNTKNIYNCIKDAESATNANRGNITQCCKLKQGSSGRDQNRKRLVWRYYEDYLLMSQKEIEDAVEKAQHPNHR